MDEQKNAAAPQPKPPPPPHAPLEKSEPASKTQYVPHLEMKAVILLVFTLCLVLGSAIYLLRARGYFDPKQQLVLIADNAEGVVAGMDLSFSGFPIGTVTKVELGEQGNVRIAIDVRERDAKWLRSSSVFTLVKGLLGGPQLRAYSGVLSDPPLKDGAERPVLRGDANEEIQRVIGAAKDVLDNLNSITAQNSELNRSMANLQVFTQKLQSRGGALNAIFGNEEDARKLVQTIERANAALARIESLSGNADKLIVNADRQVFGADGLATDARVAVKQVQGLLAEARGSLQRVDAVLKEAQGIAGNVNKATEDLGSLRGDVEANLRKIEDLINDLNRKWPFAKERKIELP
ncbi:MlaD family protein [Ramlibacter sp. XY19]|uniref:MlaD family protein n=1 Tax=Ramlibacter paludis TaxID=2908000 RepID=UPI0023DCDEAB|nr:MlaD family protein [Ramlibacter paludis]MCG2595568.1 MlaD family protein [Ramlibacter paludis]